MSSTMFVKADPLVLRRKRIPPVGARARTERSVRILVACEVDEQKLTGHRRLDFVLTEMEDG